MQFDAHLAGVLVQIFGASDCFISAGFVKRTTCLLPAKCPCYVTYDYGLASLIISTVNFSLKHCIKDLSCQVADC